MNELYHHGIKGMRWGVRRYQNPDGSLTELGKRRVGIKSNRHKKSLSRYSSAKYVNKNVKDLTDDELRRRINRLQMERQLRDLSRSEESRGAQFVESLLRSTGAQIFTTVIGGTAFYLISREIERRWGSGAASGILPGRQGKK